MGRNVCKEFQQNTVMSEYTLYCDDGDLLNYHSSTQVQGALRPFKAFTTAANKFKKCVISKYTSESKNNRSIDSSNLVSTVNDITFLT